MAKSFTSVIFYFMVRCGLFGLYINRVCLKHMIHISEAEIGVANLTDRAGQEAGPIKTLDCSYAFHAPLVRVDKSLFSNWRYQYVLK
ncbi:unnamed protein product [Schistosoma margrebowiei]|uniref:Uncharacterized protein n=1 Tax=Schistosoma margrebowiei TaxID=48269 RepID=A0A3P8H3Q4_9TREM|nr:unnamed protein product [Schistosoma margrebowiei]